MAGEPAVADANVVQSTGHVAAGVANGIDGQGFDAHELLQALQAVRVGDFRARLPSDRAGIAGKIADTFNEIVAANERMAQQLAHVGNVVGKEGRTRHRVNLGVPSGSWRAMEESVNGLIDDAPWPRVTCCRP
jgi:hypothetical protein